MLGADLGANKQTGGPLNRARSILAVAVTVAVATVRGEADIVIQAPARRFAAEAQSLIDLLTRPDGDLVALIRESEVDARVMTIDATGRILGTSHLHGLNPAAMALSGSGLVVAGLSRTPRGTGYHEDVVFWMVSAAGVLSGPHVLRPALNTTAGAYFGQVDVFSANDGVYITSTWTGFPAPKPLEIAFIADDGHVA